MGDKQYNRVASGISIFFRKLLQLVLLVLAFRFGMVFAGMVSNTEFLRNLNPEYMKLTLNNTLPIMDMVYNNGRVSTSLSGEIKDLVKAIFNFELDNPLTIMNAQSSHFYLYYVNSQKGLIAEGKADEENNIKIEYSQGDADGNEEDNMEPPSDASSISIEEPEKKNFSEDKVDVSDGKLAMYNETKFRVNVNELVKEPLKFKFDKNASKVLVYHTHATESYIKNIAQINTGLLTRTRDTRYSVVRVGDELTKHLEKKYGFHVIHNGTLHDYPDYNKSYANALRTVSQILKSYPSTGLVLDIHRDSIAEKKKLRLVTNVNGKNAAQIMFVVATGEVASNHPTWRENLKLALKLQQRLNEISPGLARPIYLSKYRYNQHLSNGALIIEIGGDGNLLDECLESTRYIAQAISDVVEK